MAVWLFETCDFIHCQFQCPSQDNGADAPVKTLREIIQACEAAGMVDLEVGGHVHSRPASVVQGNSTDQLLVLPCEFFSFCPQTHPNHSLILCLLQPTSL